MSKVREVKEQYNLDNLSNDVYTGERRMILELMENNYPNWVYQAASNSVAYEVKDYILKSELADVLINLEDFGATATLAQLTEILTNK